MVEAGTAKNLLVRQPRRRYPPCGRLLENDRLRVHVTPLAGCNR